MADPERIDILARKLEQLQAEAAVVEERLANLREQAIRLVEKEGTVPPKARKTVALTGNDYQLRVRVPQEITVETSAARRIAELCRRRRGLFARLFRRVETFELQAGAEDLINSPRLPRGAPSRLRALFARAIRVKDLAPQLEIRRLEDVGQKEPAA